MKKTTQYSVNRNVILVCTAIFMLSIGGSRPIISLLAHDLNASSIQIGSIVSMFSILPLFLSILIGKIIDRLGSKIPMNFAIYLGIVSLILPFFINSLVGLYMSQVLAGLSQVMFVISMQTYVGKISSKANIRDFYIAIFSIGVAIGQFVGPIISGYLSEDVEYVNTLAVLGLFLFAAIPLTLVLKKQEEDKGVGNSEEKENKRLFDLLRISNLRKALLISAIVLIAKDLYVAFFPLLAIEKGISTTEIGVIVALNSGAGIVIRLFLPALLKRFSTNFILKITFINAAIIYLIHPLFSEFYLLGILSFILGLSLGVAQPMSISVTINSLPVERVGEGVGLRLTFNKLTQVILPVLLGVVTGPFGISGVFYITGVFILAGSINKVEDSKPKG